jgi:hypothetical protein
MDSFHALELKATCQAIKWRRCLKTMPDGLWVGVGSALSIYDHGAFRPITRPDGSPIGFATGIAEDTANTK